MAELDIQKYILTQLLTENRGFRYSELQPPEVQSDLFTYHLKQTIKKGYVEKHDNQYFLSTLGKDLVLDLKPIDPKGKEDDKFKMIVNPLLIQRDNDSVKILFQTRTRQPFAGRHEVIGGGIRTNEPVEQAAKRRLFEETGLIADFRLIGVIRWMRLYKDVGVKDRPHFICLSQNYSGELMKQNEYGENYWIGIDEAIKIYTNSDYKSPYLVHIFGLIKHNQHIPFSYVEEQNEIPIDFH